MTKRVRWECPNGCPGVLGPTRPRRDNVVRYCLACSAKAGRLVERSAPAVMRKRQTKAEAAAEKRKAKAEREAARERRYYTVAGIDLRDEMKRYCRLKALGGPRGRLAKHPPRLVIRRCSEYPLSRLGRCSGSHEIMVAAYPGIDQADVRETLLHELAHAAVPYSGHGDRWRRKFRDAAEEAWGILRWPKVAYHGTYAADLRKKDRRG